VIRSDGRLWFFFQSNTFTRGAKLRLGPRVFFEDPIAGNQLNTMFRNLALACALALSPLLRAADAPAAPGHDHGAPAADSKAPEPKESMFLSVDPKSPKTARLVVVSAYNAVNYGMNFNGFAKGGARYTIPQGWTVSVVFTNNSPVPHSAIVVEKPVVKKLQMGEPAFKGASTPYPVRGTTGKVGVPFQFVADEAGEFAIACGFPSHSANGHWIAFDVSAAATAPSLQFGDKAPYVAH
jgi:hypothetical protein